MGVMGLQREEFNQKI